MSQRIKLEEAKLEDLPEVQRLAEVTWKACYPGIISEGQIRYMLDRGYQLDVLEKDLEERNIRFVLARIDNEPVGFGAHGIHSECDQIKLHKLYVHPRKQRLGIGHRIVEYIANQRREEAFQTIILAVNKGNSKAIAAYRKYGFTHRESVVVDIGHGYQMDDYILELPL